MSGQQTGEKIYQNSLTKSDQIKILVEYAINTQKIKRFGVMYPDISFGLEYLHLFTQEVQKQGGEVVAASSYDTDTQDFKKPIRELRHKKVQGLFIPDSGKRIAIS